MIVRTFAIAAAGLSLLGGIAPALAHSDPMPMWRQQGLVPRIGADSTATLQARIDSTPDGGTLTLEADAQFRVDGTLRIENRRNFTLNGNGATIYAITQADRARRHLSMSDGVNIRVTGLTVLGANPYAGIGDLAYQADLEAQHAFEVLGTKNVELDNLQAYDVYGDFVYVGKGTVGASNVRIHDNTFSRNGRQGVSVTEGTNVFIERNDISGVRRATFDLEPHNPAAVVDKVTIRDNTVGTGRLKFVASAGQGQVNNVTVANNVLKGKSLNILVTPPVGVRRTGWTLTGNTSDSTYGSPIGAVIVFYQTDAITVTGNYQPLQSGRDMVGVDTNDGCDVVVSGNQFPGGVGESTPEATC